MSTREAHLAWLAHADDTLTLLGIKARLEWADACGCRGAAVHGRCRERVREEPASLGQRQPIFLELGHDEPGDDLGNQARHATRPCSRGRVG